MNERPIRVSLLASSFSGSTLFGIMASQHPAFVAFGDAYLRRGAKADTVICSCGEPIEQCPLRLAAGKVLAGRGIDSGVIYKPEFRIPGRAVSRRFGGLRVLGAYRALGRALGYRRVYGTFIEREGAVLDALQSARPETRFFLDGSKNMVRAAILMAGDSSSQLIHLLRHPFEVFHSGATRHERYAGDGLTVEQHVDSWCEYNLLAAEMVRRNPGRSLSVRFADLVDPVSGPTVFSAFSDHLGWPSLQLDRTSMDPTRAHVVGNRSRHEATRVREQLAPPSAEALAEIGLGSAGIDKLALTAEKLGLDPV